MKSIFPNPSDDEQRDASRTDSDEADGLDSVVDGYGMVVDGLKRKIKDLKRENRFLADSNRKLADSNRDLTEENEALAEENRRLHMTVKEREMDQQRQQQLSQASGRTLMEATEAILANELDLAEGALPEMRMRCFAKTSLFLQLPYVSEQTKQRIKDLLKDTPCTPSNVSITNFAGSFNGTAQIDMMQDSPQALK